jgi:hypothetical protein
MKGLPVVIALVAFAAPAGLSAQQKMAMPGMDMGEVHSAAPPMAALDKAIQAKDAAAFKTAFGDQGFQPAK